MQALILFVLASLNPPAHPICDTFAIIELNRYHDENAKLVLTQIIFWDWSHAECDWRVCDWRLFRDKHQLPALNSRSGYYEAIWEDRGSLRKVQAKQFRETWTNFDPELADRKLHPTSERRKLYDRRRIERSVIRR